MDKLSQKNQVLKYIQKHGSITPIEALNNIGSFRLGARVYDLKQEGHNIINLNKSGNERFAKYAFDSKASISPVNPLKPKGVPSPPNYINSFVTPHTLLHGCFNCCMYYRAAENGKKCKIC